MIRTNSFILACLLIAMSAITMRNPNGLRRKVRRQRHARMVMQTGTFTIGALK